MLVPSAWQFLSSTQIAITKAASKGGGQPIPWRAEPGPLKIVGVDTAGAGRVELNPEGGGVVVAVVRADVVVEENDSLYVYQSAKEIRVNGGGFDDHVSVRTPFLFRCLFGFVVLFHLFHI